MKCTSSRGFIRVIRENPWLPLPFQEELGPLHIRRSRDLDIAWRSHHHRHLMSRALDQRSFIGAEKPVSRGFVERLLQHTISKTLRRLRHDYALAWYGCGDDSTFGSSLHLL